MDKQIKNRIAFCDKYIPLLQVIEDDSDLKQACSKYSAYIRQNENPHPALMNYLYKYFMREAYHGRMVITNYDELIQKNKLESTADIPTSEKLKDLDSELILACIAYHFRADHFDEGSLINISIAKGYILIMLKEFRKKI